MVQLNTCTICEGPIEPNEFGWDGGDNAAPIAKGFCCKTCHVSMVLPARFAGVYAHPMREKHADMMATRVTPGGNLKKWDGMIQEAITAHAVKQGLHSTLALRISRNQTEEE